MVWSNHEIHGFSLIIFKVHHNFMRKYILIYFLVVASTSFGQEKLASLDLAGTNVDLIVHRSERPGYLFYNMHDNENTGVEAAIKVIKKQGGILFELAHSGGRYIEFDYDTLHFKIDPNRIYTDTGVWRELDRSAIRDTVVFKMVRAFSDTLIKLLDIENQEVVMTLHNNNEKGYSMLSYLPGAEYENDAEAVYNAKWKDEDEFYFVTSARLYGLLTPTGFNVVLQNNVNMTDDGSLSVYCGQRNIEYVNVEAQHGHTRANKRMIKKLLKAMQ